MKILFIFWHGNGDCAVATTAFKKYKEVYPDRKVGVATLKNRGNVPVDLLSPFVDEVVPILSEPWDWPEKYGKPLEKGRRVAVKEARDYAKENGYDEVVEITMAPLMATLKGARIAMELGVYPLDDDKPVINISEEDDKFGRLFTSGIQRPIIFYHGVAGNISKSLPPEQISNIIDNMGVGSLIECDSSYNKRSIKYKPTSIMQTAGLMKHCDKIICIDSIVLHIAHALGLDTDAIFTITPPEQIFESVPANINIIRV